MNLAKIVLVALFGFIVLTLQGCGCDEEALAGCTDVLKCDTYSTCVKDAGCCDYENGGVKWKDSVKSMCDSLKLLGGTGTNACA